LEIDHYVPRSKGGSSQPSNLKTACRECNLGKGNMIIKNVVDLLGVIDHPSRKMCVGGSADYEVYRGAVLRIGESLRCLTPAELLLIAQNSENLTDFLNKADEAKWDQWHEDHGDRS